MAWFGSLRSRLMLVMAVVFVLGASNVAIYLLDLDSDIRSHVLNEQIDTLLARADATGDRDITELPLSFSESDWRYALYGADGTLLQVHPAGSAPLAYIAPRSPPLTDRTVSDARALPDGRVLVVRRSEWTDCEELCQILTERVAGSFAIFAVLGGISLVAMALLANWMLGSVRRAAALAATVGRERPDLRIPLDGLPSEVVPLAAAANEAFDRLASAYAAERRFTVDAAHELRTPLTVLDLRIQRARGSDTPDWDAIGRDMAQMRRLVDQLMALARADDQTNDAGRLDRVAVGRVVREAVADILPAYEAAGRGIGVDAPDGMAIDDGKGQLRQALRNLLENAIRHGRGDVVVRVRPSAAGMVSVEVSDEGPAIDAREGERLFDRFRKGRQQSDGSGLGLAIVRQLARNLGGDARIGDGPGFSVIIELPLQTAPTIPVASSASSTEPSTSR